MRRLRFLQAFTCGFVLNVLFGGSAAVAVDQMLYTLDVDPDSGGQNFWVGTLGMAFATWQPGATVSHLGFYDSFGDGLINSHTINLFLSTSSGGTGGLDSILASVVVPAGTSAELRNGYRWVPLETPLILADNTWHTVSTDVDGVDLWGDLTYAGSGVTLNDPYYSFSGWGSTYARYGNPPVSDEPQYGSFSGAVYPVVNLGSFASSPPSDIVIDVQSGIQTQAEAGYAVIDSATSVTKTGAGGLVMDAANGYTGPTSVSAGTLEVANPAALAATSVTIDTGATLSIGPGVTMRSPAVLVDGGTISAAMLAVDDLAGITSLAINAGTIAGSPAVTIDAGGSMALVQDARVTVAVGSLTVAEGSGGGRLDVGAGQMSIAAGGISAADLRSDIIAGRNGGAWNGSTGITSSAAAVATASSRAVGYVVNADGSATVSFAAPGDTDLSGAVNVFDLVSINASGRYGSGTAAEWSDGDVNYDGVTNIFDLVGINSGGAYGQGNYYPAAPTSLGRPAAVPEPAATMTLALGLAAVGRRVWRRAVPRGRKAAGGRPASCLRILAGSLVLALATSGLPSRPAAALTFDEMLYTLNYDPSAGPQNSWTGTVGMAFATWQSGAMVSHVGYYDRDGDGLANSHTINLFQSTSSGGSGGPDSILASATVPAGTAAELVDGFRWVALSSPLSLPANTWYTLAVDVDGVDLFGDLMSIGPNVTMAEPYYSNAGWGSPYARYGSDPVSDEPLLGSFATSIYPVVNLAYVPEPTPLLLPACGLVGAFGWGWYRKRRTASRLGPHNRRLPRAGGGDRGGASR